MRKFPVGWMALGLATVLIGSVMIDVAQATGRVNRIIAADIRRGFVVTESWGGSDEVFGRVRPWLGGAQVQLPGGSWEDCIRSCAETLRVNTVDFWDTQEEPSGVGGERGILLYVWP